MKVAMYNRYLDYVMKYGIRESFTRLCNKYTKKYHKEYLERVSHIDVNKQKNTIFDYEPLISIIVPVYNVQKNYFTEMIDSVIRQTYSKWELCIADASDSDIYKNIIDEYGEDRIKYVKLKSNCGIAGNTNKALELAKGDYITLLDHDDMISIDALYEIVNRINLDNKPDVIYTDEDKVQDSNIHIDPYYKQDYNYDMLHGNNYICHMFVVKRSIATKIGGFRSEFDGAQDYDFIIRCISNASKISHIDKILYHWRIHNLSVAGNPLSKEYAYIAGKRAISEWIREEGYEGKVLRSKNHPGCYMVKYAILNKPKVTIVIHDNNDNCNSKKCLDILMKKNTYENVEYIVADNDIYSAIIKAAGEYVILIDSNMSNISKGFVEKLLMVCQRSNTACVGGKITYKNNIVQAGITVNTSICQYELCGMHRRSAGYFYNGIIRRNTDATSATCMMIKKELIDKYISYEAKHTQKEYIYRNRIITDIGIDICTVLKDKGYLTVITPDVELRLIQRK